MSRPRVLLLAYNYPPDRLVGGHRARGFARHLPEFGWSPVVLTHQPESASLDATMDDGSAEGVEILRTPPGEVAWVLQRSLGKPFARLREHSAKSAKPSAPTTTSRLRSLARTYLYIPDGNVAWYPSAVKAALSAARRAPFDAIVSSYSPATSHLVARKLARHFRIPWVADYRDSWTSDPTTAGTSSLRRALDKFLERRILADAAGLTAVAEPLVEELRETTRHRVPVHLIRNGFDPEAFAGIQPQRRTSKTLTHVGRFYGLFRDPTPLFRTLRRMIDARALVPGELQLRIVGAPEAAIVDLCERFSLRETVHFTGPVSHREALVEEVSASALLCFLADTPVSLAMPPAAKLFEYLGAGTPMLAIAPPASETARIIEDAKAGVVVPPSSEAELEQALKRLMAGTFAPSAASGSREKYGRRETARRLAALLDELTDSRTPHA